jgi:hypothetical protein
MKLNAQGKNTIEQIRLINEYPLEDCKHFFESLVTHIFLNYLDEKPTYIPYFGEITLKYDGEDIVQGGREARVSLSFIADQNLKKIIGQSIDGEETEIERVFKSRANHRLELTIEDQ